MTVIPFPEPFVPDGPQMYCASCHTERKNPSTAGDPGPCKCGSTLFVSEPLVGKVWSGSHGTPA